MFAHLMQFVLKQKFLVLLFGAAILGLGTLAWQTIPTDAFPDVTNVQVMVLTKATGLAPLEVERQVTFPIELEMKGIPRVQHVRSLSRAGLSQVVVIFDDGVDIYFARQLVLERLLQAKEKLPAGIDPEMGPVSTGLGEIFQYVVKSGHYCPQHRGIWEEGPGVCPECRKSLSQSNYSLTELRTIQDWIIAPQIRKLRGIGEVNSFGGFVKQYHVLPDPNWLLKYNVSIGEVIEALENNNANSGGNYLVKGGEQLYIVGKGLFHSIEDIQRIVLKTEYGTPVYLSEVARVEIGAETRQGAVTQDGKGEVVAGMVVMLRGSNSKNVVREVKQAIPKIQRMLPPGVRIVSFYDRTSLIQNCISTVGYSLLQGGCLVVLVLFILMWDIRGALTVTLSLPLTAGITFIAMKLCGLTADMMSLGGLAIALGAVVDASIIVTENIVRHYQEGASSQESRTQLAYRAVAEVARPIVFAVLIVVVVFLPLFTLESLEKKMFEPLALTMCFAMAASLFVALTVVAVVASLVSSRKKVENGVETFLLKLYLPLLRFLLDRPSIAWVLCGIFLIGLFFPLPFLGTEFMPPLDEGAIAVNIVRFPSASLDFTKEQSTFLESRLLEKFPEIETVVSKSGRAEIAEDPMGPEQTDMFIMLKPYSRWETGRNKERLVEDIRKEMERLPGLKPAFSQPIALRVNELISGVKSDVAIKIFGEDLEVLKTIAEKISPILGHVKGAADIKIEQISGFSQIEIEIDRKEIARHKINVQGVNLMIEAAIGGKIVTYFLEGERRFAVLVRFPERYRDHLLALERILVNSPLGYSVPLGKLARVAEKQVPSQVSREDGERRLIIECNIRGRDMGGFISEVKEKIERIEKELPPGYRIDWGGQFENQQRAMKKLSVAVPVAVLIIVLMLYLAFRSLKSTFMVLLNLPFAVVGGLWMLLIFDINISVSAVIGLIALLGMAVEDGTVLVSFFEVLRAKGLSTRQAVLEGARLRMRSILSTTLTTLLGLFPMLYALGPGSEIQRPLAIVVIGGLFSALLLVLFLFPVLYLLFHQEKS